MKHNPRLHERVAALPGHARLHPLQDPARAQGALELMWRLQGALGGDRRAAARLAAALGRVSRRARGGAADARLPREPRRGRHKVLTPDTAHGTNPATVTMAGLEVVKLATDAHGGVDIADLRAKADADVACLMLTNPNTLGVFDPNIGEIARDRARRGRDAVLRRRQPERGDGHLAPRATWASTSCTSTCTSPSPSPTAAAGRARGRSPSASGSRHSCRGRWSCAARTAASTLDGERPKSIGRLRGFHGNYGCFVRAYAYICSLGADGLRDASESAVMNANYLLARLQQRAGERLPLAYGEQCMHEFVLSGAPMKRELGDQDARPRQAPARLRLPPADRLLPAAGGRGADGRAHRDRDARDARRLRAGDRRDPARGRARSRRSRAARPTRRPCAASTRSAAARHPVVRQQRLLYGSSH